MKKPWINIGSWWINKYTINGALTFTFVTSSWCCGWMMAGFVSFLKPRARRAIYHRDRDREAIVIVLLQMGAYFAVVEDWGLWSNHDVFVSFFGCCDPTSNQWPFLWLISWWTYLSSKSKTSGQLDTKYGDGENRDLSQKKSYRTMGSLIIPHWTPHYQLIGKCAHTPYTTQQSSWGLWGNFVKGM